MENNEFDRVSRLYHLGFAELPKMGKPHNFEANKENGKRGIAKLLGNDGKIYKPFLHLKQGATELDPVKVTFELPVWAYMVLVGFGDSTGHTPESLARSIVMHRCAAVARDVWPDDESSDSQSKA